MSDRGERQFDVIVHGATGFTGLLVAEYLQRQYGINQSLRWAIAGRDEQKLQTARASLGENAAELPIIVADSFDKTALDKLVAQTKVVISTVGPYALYGSPLVKICAQTGTHYCDLAGEAQWIKRMQDLYENDAKQSGAWIVHCCGFDSIPSDLGVHFLQRLSADKFNAACTDIKMGVAKLKGGASGGTVASIVNLAKEASGDAALRKELSNPYSTCPEGHGFSARQNNVKAEYDEDFNSWLGPFIMAAINTRVVHRSNALSGNSYGNDFKYQEAMMTGEGSSGKSAARKIGLGMGGFMIGASLAPIRWGLERWVLPKPGEGPSEKEQLEGSFHLIFVGRTDKGEVVRCQVKGDRDPGYGSTAKMLGQAAACLANDVAVETPGGFWTPATLMGDQLIERLEKYSGLEFSESDATA